MAAKIWFNAQTWFTNSYGAIPMSSYMNQWEEEQSKIFKWLSKKDEETIFNYADSTWASQLEKNMIVNELYKQALQDTEKTNRERDRLNTSLEMTNKSVTAKDEQTAKQFKTTLRIADLADVIRQDADKQWYDLWKTSDQEVVSNYINDNPKKAEQVKSILKWESDLVDFANELWVFKSSGNRDIANGNLRWLANQMNWEREWWGEILDTMLNPIWWAFEWLDNKIQSIEWFTWEWMEEDLMNRLNDLSDEELAAYQKKWDSTPWLQKYYPNFAEYVENSEKSYWDHLFWIDVTGDQKWPNVAKMFTNMPLSALKTVSSIARWMTNPYDSLKWLVKLVTTDEWKNAIMNRYWSWDNFAKTLEQDPVGVASDALTVTQWWSNLLWKGAKWSGRVAKLTWMEWTAATLEWASKSISNFSKAAWWASDLWVGVAKEKWMWLLQEWKNSSNAIVRNTSKALDWSAKNQMDLISTANQKRKGLGEKFFDTMAWLDKKTKALIKDNPEVTNFANQVKQKIEESNWIYEWGKEYTEWFFDEMSNEIKSKIEEYKSNRSEDSKLYNEYKKSWDKVETKSAKEWVDKVLWEYKVTKGDDWFDFKDSALTEWSNKVKDIYDYLERHDTLDWEEILILNEKFRNAKSSVKKWSTEYSLLNDMQKAVKDSFHWQSETYRELDALYEKDITLLNEISEWLTNKNWSVKSNLNNILKKVKSNPELAWRLEEIYPWLTKKVEALNALPKILDNAFNTNENMSKMITTAAAFWLFWSKSLWDIVNNIMLWAGIRYGYGKVVNARWEKALTSLSEDWQKYLKELSDKAEKWEVFTDKEREDVKRVRELIEKTKNENTLQEEIKKWEQRSLFEE